MWQLLSAVLACTLLFYIMRYLGLRRELGRLADAMREIHAVPSNRQLTIGSHQAELVDLACCINALYEDIDAQRVRHRTALEELRQGISNISHDLRTPLTSILGYLKLLRDEENTPEQRQRYVEVAYRKAGGLNRLVSDLFLLVRLENAGYPLEHQRLDAVALLGEELAAIYPQLESGGLPEVSLPDTPLWVIGDAQAVSRVFANLLQNMVAHGERPMSIAAIEEGDRVGFRFANRAPALTPKDVEQLFQRFFTGDRMRSGQGAGLGLSIAKAFMEEMRGGIAGTLEDGNLVITLHWPRTV